MAFRLFVLLCGSLRGVGVSLRVGLVPAPPCRCGGDTVTRPEAWSTSSSGRLQNGLRTAACLEPGLRCWRAASVCASRGSAARGSPLTPCLAGLVLLGRLLLLSSANRPVPPTSDLGLLSTRFAFRCRLNCFFFHLIFQTKLACFFLLEIYFLLRRADPRHYMSFSWVTWSVRCAHKRR